MMGVRNLQREKHCSYCYDDLSIVTANELIAWLSLSEEITSAITLKGYLKLSKLKFYVNV